MKFQSRIFKQYYSYFFSDTLQHSEDPQILTLLSEDNADEVGKLLASVPEQ